MKEMRYWLRLVCHICIGKYEFRSVCYLSRKWWLKHHRAGTYIVCIIHELFVMCGEAKQTCRVAQHHWRLVLFFTGDGSCDGMCLFMERCVAVKLESELEIDLHSRDLQGSVLEGWKSWNFQQQRLLRLLCQHL